MKSVLRVGGALAALGFVSIVLQGCDVASQTLGSCDPLQTVTTPVTLGQVVGIGKDQEGTVYLVDEAPNVGQRLFVSRGSVLVRQVVRGTGSVGDTDGGVLIVVGGGDVASPLSIEVRTDAAGQATAMGIFKGLLSTKTFDIGSVGESLQLLTMDAISGFTLQECSDNKGHCLIASSADIRRICKLAPLRPPPLAAFPPLGRKGGHEINVRSTRQPTLAATPSLSFLLQIRTAPSSQRRSDRLGCKPQRNPVPWRMRPIR